MTRNDVAIVSGWLSFCVTALLCLWLMSVKDAKIRELEKQLESKVGYCIAVNPKVK
jgi:hypothetical protein